MTLPLGPPLEPMLAKLSRTMPEGDYLYEPKWDGFRCIVFRDGDEIELQSRGKKSLVRYFPELIDPLRGRLPERCVVDGEIVVAIDGELDFDALSNRIHPAESRVKLLAERTPARFVAFDLLAFGDDVLLDLPFSERRARLEAAITDGRAPVHVTPVTRDRDVAEDWFERFEGAGFDGVIAKPAGEPYVPGKRTLLKVKHERTTDVVVGGYRIHKDGNGVGSLMLGLYDDRGRLHHVGVASSFSAARRAELLEELADHRLGDGGEHPWIGGWSESGTDGTPRGGNRWNADKDMSWEPLRIGLVAEVAYEQLQGDRFRHSARFKRWRPDRDPESCHYDQLEVPTPAELREVLEA